MTVAEIGVDIDGFPTANPLALHTTNFVLRALKGFAPRTYRKIPDPKETTGLQLPLANVSWENTKNTIYYGMNHTLGALVELHPWRE
jgi:hypothetical protein